MSERIVQIFGHVVGFKIRSKKDAEHFLHMKDSGDFCHYKGELYWTDGETDYCLDASRESVSTRPVAWRGNIFNPYFDEGKGYVDLIWKTRKYINAQWFTKEEW